jgi:hypothetical protein
MASWIMIAVAAWQGFGEHDKYTMLLCVIIASLFDIKNAIGKKS